MMGRQHALAGTAAWLAAAPLLDQSPGQVALGALVAAGAGMVPDLDQRGSTIGRTYGPLTNVAARVIGAVSGGHRNGTHSLIGVAVFTAVAYLAAEHGGPLRWVLLWVLLGVACRAYGVGVPGHRALTSLIHAVTMGVLTAAVLAAGVDLTMILVAGMFLGTLSHVVADMLTPQRCPLLWPVSKARYGVGLVTTGNRWTSPLVTFLLTVLVGVLVVV